MKNDRYCNGMMVWMELRAKTVLGVGGMDFGIHSYLVEVYLWQSGAAEGGLHGCQGNGGMEIRSVS